MAGYHGYFLWHELMTTDPDGAKAFYPAVTDWSLTPGGIPDLEYDMWTTARGPVGGCMLLPVEARSMGAGSHWIPYMGTTDIASTAARAGELGARTFVPVTDIPDIGQFAVLADPQGAMFALYQPGVPSDEEARPQVGDFSWHELMTTDAPAALAFYGDLFGWTETGAHDMGPMGIYHLFGGDGHTFGGMLSRTADMPGESAWLCYVRTDNAQAAAAAVTNAGGMVMNGPMEVPGGDWIVQCRDPQDAAFALHVMPAPPPA